MCTDVALGTRKSHSYFRLEHGFTLYELLIVLAIIGILAAIAIPNYQDYVIRAKVTEGIQLASSAQLAIEETATFLNALPTNQAQTGYISPAATVNVSAITIGRNGRITIRYTATAGNGTITLRPTLNANSSITWICTGGTLQDRYRPPNCR